MFQRILIPIDGSSCSDEAVDQGLALALSLGARVTFLYVVEDPFAYLPADLPAYTDVRDDMRRAGDELLAAVSQRARERGVAADARLVTGTLIHPVQAILDAEVDYDLVLMGTHGRRGFDRMFLGSVTDGVLRRSTKPHLVIRCQPSQREEAGAGE
jgi:nucleotide-binding universal stress UspA family protein